MSQEFSQGTKVMFQLEGQEGSFYGVVTRMHNGKPLIQPEVALSPNAQIKNVEEVKS